MYGADHAPDDDFLTDDDIPEVPGWTGRALSSWTTSCPDHRVLRGPLRRATPPTRYGLAYRIVSLILGDADEITPSGAASPGKSETLAMVIAGVAVLFPSWPRRSDPGEVPEGRVDRPFSPHRRPARHHLQPVADKLTSPCAIAFLSDPEIDEGQRRIEAPG